MLRALTLLAPLLLAACKDSKTAADVGPCVETTAQTAGEGVKTGGKTAVEGLKTFGKSVGGLFEDGTEGAKREWKAGSQKTSETAKGGGASTKGAAKQVDCD